MKKLALMTLVLAVAAVAAQAVPTVTLTAVFPTNTSWELYAAISGGSAGLSSFDITFGGGAFGQVTTSTLKAPKLANSNTDFQGFSSTLASKGVIAAGKVTGISSGQGSIWVADPGDPDLEAYKTALVIQGVGISAVQAIDAGDGSNLGNVIGAPVLLAQGKGTNTQLGMLPFAAVGNLLAGTVGTWTGPGNMIDNAAWVFGTGFVPEPATMSLLLVGGIAALRRRS